VCVFLRRMLAVENNVRSSVFDTLTHYLMFCCVVTINFSFIRRFRRLFLYLCDEIFYFWENLVMIWDQLSESLTLANLNFPVISRWAMCWWKRKYHLLIWPARALQARTWFPNEILHVVVRKLFSRLQFHLNH